MRSDMFKVIVERPRWGAGRARSVKLKRSRDPNCKFIGLKKHVKCQGSGIKLLNENLQPLVRFLRSKRGCRWDDVFSEICAQLDTGSTVKMHVRLHLDDIVATRVSIGRRGEWLFRGEVLNRPHRWSRRDFFVDPRDGLLKDWAELPKHVAAGVNGKGVAA